jgi:hypothetical protein
MEIELVTKDGTRNLEQLITELNRLEGRTNLIQADILTRLLERLNSIIRDSK